MGPLLALASAACYGVADFAGGLLSRRANPVRVALTAQSGALVVTAITALVVDGVSGTMPSFAWGGLSGIGTGIGMAFLYRGISRGDLSVVLPLTAVGGVVLPVVAGVALLGERPSGTAWSGMAIAIPALWLLLRTRGGRPSAPDGKADAMVASVGIALQYLAIAQAEAGSGLWPVAAGRLTAVLTILALARSTATGRRLSRQIRVAAVLVGTLASLALFLYLLATRQEMLTTTVVLASLYPVVPVLFGVTLFAEPLSKRKVVGLVAALIAVVLLAAS